MRVLSGTLVLVVVAIGPHRAALADKTEEKAIATHPIPHTTRKVSCVLKMTVGVDAPTSFGGPLMSRKKAAAWITTTAGPSGGIDSNTMTLTIKPSSKDPKQEYADAVE